MPTKIRWIKKSMPWKATIEKDKNPHNEEKTADVTWHSENLQHRITQIRLAKTKNRSTWARFQEEKETDEFEGWRGDSCLWRSVRPAADCGCLTAFVTEARLRLVQLSEVLAERGNGHSVFFFFEQEEEGGIGVDGVA